MNEKFDEVARDTFRYFYVDGLVEIAIGFLFLVIGLVLLAWVRLDISSWPGILAVLALVLFTIGGTALVKRGVSTVKEQLTYRRTGYVAYEQGEPRAGRWPVVGAALLLVILLTVVPEALNKMPLVVGAVLGILLTFMGYRVHLRRFYLLGAFSFLIGMAATLLLGDELMGASLTIAGSGLALLMSGAAVLLAYVQANPPLGEE